MFARSLESVLRSLCAKADMHWPATDEFQARFEALRACALLPRGRENRTRRLTSDEIANAVLSIVPQHPTQAGFAAKILGGLVPAGGRAASFHEAPSLQSAVAKLITDDAARATMHALTLSVAEGGTNATGYAQLLYEHPQDGLKRAFFVGKLATSVIRAGGEGSMRPEYRHSPASRELVLNRQFFDQIGREVERSTLFEQPPGEGEEYDAEEAQAAEHKRLGVRPGSQYLNIGVDTQVTWLKERRLVRFGRYELVLMPKTATHAASVHIDLAHHRLQHEEGLTVINRFLSWLAWQDDHYAIVRSGWSGNPVPGPVPAAATGFLYSHHWVTPDPPELSPDQLRALALYREGRNAEENRIVSFAVLSYYKILEIACGPENNAPKALIRRHLPQMREAHSDDATLAEFQNQFSLWKSKQDRGQDEFDYIYKAWRTAVAHGSRKSVSDPDELLDLRRLHVVADVLRQLARCAMQFDLEIPGNYSDDDTALPGAS